MSGAAARAGLPFGTAHIPRPMSSSSSARRLVGAALAACLGVVPALASAQDVEHRGLMGRVAVGVGYVGSTASDSSSSMTVAGVSPGFHLAVGAYAIPNLAVHATFWGGAAINPSVAYTSALGSGSAATSGASVFAWGLGGGLTYVVAPLNLYFTGSLGVGLLSASSIRAGITTTASASAGFAFILGLGKQWAVGRTWGFGISAQVGWQSNADDHNGTTPGLAWSTPQGALLFSVTYH